MKIVDERGEKVTEEGGPKWDERVTESGVEGR